MSSRQRARLHRRLGEMMGDLQIGREPGAVLTFLLLELGRATKPAKRRKPRGIHGQAANRAGAQAESVG